MFSRRVLRRCSHRVEKSAAASPLPLEGYRILDLSRILAGPFCSMLLADLGAEVIKIEHTLGGDDTRSWGPPFSDAGNESAYFLSVNRNKKSVAVNLKTPEGLQVVRDLAAQSDVLLENFIPGKLEELGLGYDAVHSVNDQLVYASLSGFGSTGPRARLPAYDVMVSALGGFMGITGTPDGQVCKAGVAITDVCSGLVMHGAIMAALLARVKTGRGQRIETSLLDTQIAVLANIASNFLVSGVVTGPQGTAHPSIVPYQGFTCANGKQIIVGALNNGQFAKLAEAIGKPDLATDPAFDTNPHRVENREEVVRLLSDAFASPRPFGDGFGGGHMEWAERLEAAGVPCAPINSMDEVFQEKQVINNKRVIQVEHPTIGMLKMVAPAATFHGTPLTRFAPPPLHGQHTMEVLTGLLGLSEERVSQLAAKGVLKTCADLSEKKTS